ncbi:diguanylate cyclase [Oleispirillum naphthae]|uniref:diguanylate cyclase n=1 Tax=Oleispirillum naphthae TaxID=2838853 RepID=UPI003082524F
MSRLLPGCELESILDSLPLAVFLKSRDLGYTWCNRRFEEICGCLRTDLPERLAFEGLKGPEADKARESDLAVLNSGEHRIYDARISCPCGMSIDARFLKIPAINRAGDIVGIIGVAIDLTGDREAERKLLHNLDYMAEENARLERIASDLQTSLAFSEDNAAQLAELAEQIDSQKQSIAEQNEQIRRLMYRDDNTGLHNRRYFFDTAPLMLSQPADPARPGLLAIADIDFFKSINDRFGHAAGDAALRSFAQVAADALPETALFCRVGGEEFAILTAPMSIPEAEALLNRLRETIGAHHLHLGPESNLNFTISIGATPLCAGGNLDELLHAADNALYMAKRGGRDRVVVGA